MKTIKEFLWDERKQIAVFLVMQVVCIGIEYLYGTNKEEQNVYEKVLLLFLFMLYLTTSFFYFIKKKKELYLMEKSIEFQEVLFFKPYSIFEKLYQNIILSIRIKHDKMVVDFKKQEDEAQMYYLMWSHQIKTPISAMKLILEEKETDNTKELLLQLFEIEEYVEMNLNFSRLFSNETDYLLKEYSVDHMVRQCIRKYATMFIRKKIQIQYDELANKIITDEKWFCFALNQIISNALKYTNTGYIKIYSKNRNDKQYLIVEDTGIGIRNEDIPRIFERGYTGFNGRIDKSATGIGLYLCKQVLKNLGSDITIASTLGKGTCVSILLDNSSY